MPDIGLIRELYTPGYGLLSPAISNSLLSGTETHLPLAGFAQLFAPGHPELPLPRTVFGFPCSNQASSSLVYYSVIMDVFRTLPKVKFIFMQQQFYFWGG